MRRVANFDAARYAAVAQWPLREVLLTYLAQLDELKLMHFHRRQDWYMHGRLRERPKPPKVSTDG